MVLFILYCWNLHGGETAGGGIVGERRLADAVEGVTRVAAEIVVEALDGVGDVERSGKDSASPVVGGVPVGDDGFVGERAECVIRIGRVDAARPGALGEASESVVLVLRAVAVRVIIPQTRSTVVIYCGNHV